MNNNPAASRLAWGGVVDLLLEHLPPQGRRECPRALPQGLLCKIGAIAFLMGITRGTKRAHIIRTAVTLPWSVLMLALSKKRNPEKPDYA
ncbi:hypothetical protein FACS189485_07550 [Spirochaetia bacterium]|nr:hypothetical protein FACS189485_07550 [Spirochaetia bacterium]